MSSGTPKQLRECLHQGFQRTLLEYQNRLKHPERVHWAFERIKHPFLSDYFALNTIGYGLFSQSLNIGLSQYAPFLWKKTMWKHISRLFLERLDSMFQEKFPALEKEFSYKNELHKCVEHDINDLHTMTVAELMTFGISCLHDCGEILLGTKDIFKAEKKKQNLACYPFFQLMSEDLLSHPRAIRIYLYFITKFNWIDNFEKKPLQYISALKEELNEMLDTPDTERHLLTPDLYAIEHFLSQPGKKVILYECDNTGEVMVDLAFIYWLLHRGHKVLVTGKGTPVFNDVTVDDLHLLLKKLPEFHLFVQRNQLILINTHSRSVGKNLYLVSPDYIQAYQEADLLILKGQGNFQTMPIAPKHFQYKKPMLFSFIVKAQLIQLCLQKKSKKRPQIGESILFSGH